LLRTKWQQKKQLNMKTLITVHALLLTITLGLFSCNKSEANPPAPAPATGSFTWTENAGAVVTADSAFWTTGAWGTGIRAYKGAGMANFFEINWNTINNTSVGAKALPTPFGFTFLKGASSYTNPAAQSLSVTAFAGNLLSGNCTVAVTGGSITNLVCTFTNLPQK
jgi:hypothetical protein